jgi:hypothetical protein
MKTKKTVETVSGAIRPAHTRLKPGANGGRNVLPSHQMAGAAVFLPVLVEAA